ncbi:helix-turn-helix transcriptional regulator [Streptomyces sp. NBC_00154]|uniref:helix-turn-helix domain-containing protein n=1 Tax=Streptomyces sp. NBC_00154 TaxID=2975670 RepID=UPI00225BC7AC|nr:helix-turn-helix domain-containing protein [Streptomyces sp. NBC_00154]MCX5317974.1 helix-turn-helix domain-containing protein [Streptomyces sp. NBC_00154]
MDDDTPFPRAQTPQAAAYAAKMEKVLQSAVQKGLTRTDLAQASHLSKSSITRYLQGENVAPASFLAFLAEHLNTLGHALSPQDVSELNALRQDAEKNSPKPDTRLRAWEEEVHLLKSELTESSRLHQATEARLAGFEARLQTLDEELSRALTQAKAAERQRDELSERVIEQKRQLGHARAYIRQADSELAGSEAKAKDLQREVDVLRRQVRRLQKESATSSKQSVPEAATQVSAGATSSAPRLSRGTREPPTSAGIELRQTLRRWREESNGSQAFVARKLGAGQPTVSRWESGAILPAVETIQALWRIRTQATGTPPSDDAELDRALELHQLAETERVRFPEPSSLESLTTTASAPSPTPAEAGKKRTVLLTASGVALAVSLLGLMTFLLAPDYSGGRTPNDPNASTFMPDNMPVSDGEKKALAWAKKEFGVGCDGSCHLFSLNQAAAFDADRWGIGAADDVDLIANPKEAPFSYGLKALNYAGLRMLPNATEDLDAKRCPTGRSDYAVTAKAADGSEVCLLTAGGTRVMLMRMGKTPGGTGRLFMASVATS